MNTGSGAILFGVRASEQSVSCDQSRRPPARRSTKNICVKCISAHDNAFARKAGKGVFNHRIDFWKGFAEEPNIIMPSIDQGMAVESGFQRKSIVAGRDKIGVCDQNRPSPAAKRFLKKLLPTIAPIRGRQKQNSIGLLVTSYIVRQTVGAAHNVIQCIVVCGNATPTPVVEMTDRCIAAGDDFLGLDPHTKTFELLNSARSIIAGGVGQDADLTARGAQPIKSF